MSVGWLCCKEFSQKSLPSNEETLVCVCVCVEKPFGNSTFSTNPIQKWHLNRWRCGDRLPVLRLAHQHLRNLFIIQLRLYQPAGECLRREKPSDADDESRLFTAGPVHCTNCLYSPSIYSCVCVCLFIIISGCNSVAYNNIAMTITTTTTTTKSIFNSLKEESRQKRRKKLIRSDYAERKHIFYALWEIMVRDKGVFGCYRFSWSLIYSMDRPLLRFVLCRSRSRDSSAHHRN